MPFREKRVRIGTMKSHYEERCEEDHTACRSGSFTYFLFFSILMLPRFIVVLFWGPRPWWKSILWQNVDSLLLPDISILYFDMIRWSCNYSDKYFIAWRSLVLFIFNSKYHRTDIPTDKSSSLKHIGCLNYNFTAQMHWNCAHTQKGAVQNKVSPHSYSIKCFSGRR